MLASRDKISIRQAIILFIMTVTSSSLRLFPAYAAKTGERAGWLSPLFAMIPFICLVYIIQALFKNNKEANLSDVIYKVLGKVFGKAILILYLIWMLILLGTFMRYFVERFLSSVLPNAPIHFFTVSLLAVVFFAVRGGIVYIARTTEILFLIFSIVFTLLFLLNLSNVEIINLFPVTHYDLWPVVKSSFAIIGLWCIFPFIFFFGDRINDKEHIKRFGLQGTVYLVITAFIVLIQTIGSYGYSVIERVSLSYIFVIKSISFLDTIERIESVALANWVIADFVTISVVMYILVNITKSLFSVSDEKSLVSPFTIFAFILSQFIAGNRFELENFSSYVLVPATIVMGFAFPLIILILGKIRKKI